MPDLERYVKVGGKMVPGTCPEPAGGAAVHPGSGRENLVSPNPVSVRSCNAARNPPAVAQSSRGRTQLQPHLRVPGEGANWGLGPVPWSKVPGSRGTRINYQPKTVGEKGGSAGLDLSSL